MKKLFVSLVLVSLMVCFGYADADDSMVLHLTFDEGSGDVAKDQSQYGNDAQINDAEWVVGKYGSAITGQGCTTVPHSDSLVIEDEITMMAWININALRGDQNQWLDKACNNGGEHKSYGMWTSNGIISVRVGSDQNRQTFTNSGEPLGAGTWCHVAFTYGDNTGKFYVDGSFASEHELAFHLECTNEFDINIGCPLDRENYIFDGSIDELALFNRVLSEAEISEFMAGGSTAVSSKGKRATTWASIKY